MNHAFHRFVAAACTVLALVAVSLPRTAHATPVPVCILGENRIAGAGDALLTPGYGFFQLITPGDCRQCLPGAAFHPTAVSFYGWFRATCSIGLRVTFVGAVQTGTCWAPDTNNVLCPPQILTVGQQNPNGFDLYRMALVTAGTSCCLSSPCFVRVEVVRNNCSSSFKAILGTANPCQPCTSYYYSPTQGITDDCDVNSIMTGNGIIRVEGDCCSPTDAKSRTWGLMKSIYR